VAAVIKIVGRSDGAPAPEASRYLVAFNFEARYGRGDMIARPEIEHALRFPSSVAAMEFWNKPSMLRPVGADGKPNQPLRAFKIEIEEVD
jgi:hypothetical protein